MVEIAQSRIAPTARAAGQVSSGGSQQLARAAGAAGRVADTFTEFYEEEARIQNDLLFSTAQADWSQRFDESKKSAGPGYTKNILEQYDSYVSEVMASSPERGRDNLKLGFDKYRLNLQQKALSAEAAARAAAKAQAQAEAARQRSLMLARSDEPVLAYDEIIAANPDLSEKEKSALFGVAFDKFMTIGNEWAIDQARSFIDGPRGDHLSGEQYVSLERSINTAQGRLDTKNAAATKVAASAYEDWAADRAAIAAETGRTPTAEEIDAAISAIGLPEEDAARLKAETEREFRQAATFYEVAMMPQDDLAALLSSAQEKATQPDGAVEAIDYRNDLVAAVNARNAAINEDSAAYLIRNDSSLSALLTRAAEAEDEGASAVLHSRAKVYMDGLFDSLGVPPQNRTYLPAPQAKAMAQNLEQNSTGEAGLIGRQIRQNYGDMAPAVMAQLRRAGVSELTMEKIRHAGDFEVTQWLDAITGVKASDFAIPNDIKVTDISAAVNDVYEGYYRAAIAGGGAAAQSMMESKRKILNDVVMMMVSRGADPAAAADEAFQKMFPESVVESDNVLAILPDGVPESAATAAERQLENIEDTGFFLDTGLPDYVDQAVTGAALRSNGIWINNATGDGLVLAITDGVFSTLIVNEKGETIERKFSELMRDGISSQPVEDPKLRGPRLSPDDPTQTPFLAPID